VKTTLRAILGWAGVLLALAVGAKCTLDVSRPRYVLVVNPLRAEVVVRFGRTDVTIPPAGPRATARVALSPGVHEVEVRLGGGVLDRHRLTLPAFRRGTAIYNILGATPLYRVRAHFHGGSLASTLFASLDSPKRFDGFEVLAGPRLQIVEADAVFQPPDPADLGPGFLGGTKTYVGRAKGGWETAVTLAHSYGPDPAAIRELLGRLRRSMPYERGLPEREVAFAAVTDGPEAALALARDSVRRAPSSASAHRAFALLMRTTGRAAELRALYREWARQEPDSPAGMAMLLRVLRRAEAEAAAAAVVRASYASDDELWIAGQVLLGEGRAWDAAAVLGRIPVRGADARAGGDRVRALVQAGDPRAAAKAALEGLRDASPEDLALFLRVAALPGANPELSPESVLAEVRKADAEAEYMARALAGTTPRPADGDAPLSLSGILGWTSWDPARALDLCRRAPPGVLALLPPGAGALLALEGYRRGDRELFERLRWNVPLSPSEIAAYVERGIEPDDGWRLDVERRTALALARERWLRASGAPVPPAVAREARADPLRGLATFAAERWPAPERASPPLILVLDRQARR
jgi:hypothetical protein